MVELWIGIGYLLNSVAFQASVSGVNGGVITRFADPSSFTALSVSVDKGRVYILNYKGARGSPGVPLIRASGFWNLYG
ncbi:MAG: hypothetical protein ACP5MI_07440 [Candidatus Kryptoniota bacterium]